MLYQTPDRACACLPVLCLPVLPACLLFPTPERPLISDLTASAPVEPAGCWLPACVLACLFLPPVSLPTKRPRLTVGSPVEPPPNSSPSSPPAWLFAACLCVLQDRPSTDRQPGSTAQAQGKPYRALQVHRPLDPAFEFEVCAGPSPAVPRGDPPSSAFLLCAGLSLLPVLAACAHVM